MKKIALLAFVFLLFSTALVVRLVSPVAAEGTIYIRSDGSVEGTNKIQRDGNIYTLTGNIDGGIMVQEDNIVIDGAGYTLNGTEVVDPHGSKGIDMAEKNNITVKNLRITNFYHGIYMPASDNNTFYGNYIANCMNGFWLFGSSFNYIIYNTVTNNSHGGIYIVYSSSYNVVYGNNITNNAVFLWMQGQGNIVDRNYWSNYKGTDNDGDGIGDTPYVINDYRDHHPLMEPVAIPEVPDTTSPTISILSPEKNATYGVNNVFLTFTVSKTTLWMGHSLDRQANVTITGNTTLTGLSDGTHSLVVYAIGLFGNIGSSGRVYFTIDTPPSVSILSPENKTYDTTDIPLTFTVDETVTWMAYSLDGQSNVTITGNTTLSGLPDGSHNLVVYAKDTAGNTGASETIYFSIKTQQSELFPTWIVTAIVIIAVVGATLLVYFAKIKKQPGKPLAVAPAIYKRRLSKTPIH